MPQENENVFIAESQSLDVDEQQKKDILDVIESCSSFQETIKQLEEKNLIWYFIGPLRKDENITGQINLKWEKEFQKFEQSINETHREFEASLPNQNFLAYSTKDDDFKIRFENEEKPIEISNILRASSEGKVYNISLGKDSQITATKKGSERHYDFTGSSSCEMTINWQAKDSEGNSIDCSMTVKLDSGGIQSVIGEPKFGGITSSEEVLKLVGQNKEVFINGKTLYQAFTGISKSVDDQQVPAEEIFTKDLHISPQSPTPSSSGYSSPSTPSSRRSSISTSSEFSDEDEIFEDDMSGDEKEYEQEGAKDEVEELEEEKETFAKYFAVQAKQLEDLRLERDSLKSTLAEFEESYKEKEDMLQEELKSAKESLEQLQNILQQEKGLAATSTQTEVEYESRGTSMQQQDQGIQAVNNNSSRIASGLRQENKKLTRDKLTISEQLKQKIREIDELKKNLKQLQEENKQLKQEVTKNAGVDASSSTDQREAKEAEAIPQNIMDWPVPIPDDKPEEQKTPLEPIKVNTELSDPKSIPAEGPEKSPPLSK
ncbi:hypothetical protein [Wolbachia endosymbiont (group A) of Agelastica alni]|uniref:hypothetical protein n=1 Tax=Wolbachia endosymbiont (group A) of Agelastica alni TaxID=3066130 RepID=UPI003132E296